MDNNESEILNAEEISENSQNTSSHRVYHAPRLDSAIEFQKSNFKHGKITAPILTLLTFIGGPFGFFGVVGLIAYWVVLLRHKSELELKEKALFRENKIDGLVHDISEMQCFWFKFGPAISYITSILVVAFIILKFILGYLWNNSN